MEQSRESQKDASNEAAKLEGYRNCKKNKIGKHLKATIPNELKGQLLDELRNS